MNFSFCNFRNKSKIYEPNSNSSNNQYKWSFSVCLCCRWIKDNEILRHKFGKIPFKSRWDAFDWLQFHYTAPFRFIPFSRKTSHFPCFADDAYDKNLLWLSQSVYHLVIMICLSFIYFFYFFSLFCTLLL